MPRAASLLVATANRFECLPSDQSFIPLPPTAIVTLITRSAMPFAMSSSSIRAETFPESWRIGKTRPQHGAIDLVCLSVTDIEIIDLERV
jgi:hypothetical protein